MAIGTMVAMAGSVRSATLYIYSSYVRLTQIGIFRHYNSPACPNVPLKS